MNTGKNRWGGAISAAMFLKEFAGDTPWVHLDIAGCAWNEEKKPWIAYGPVGYRGAFHCGVGAQLLGLDKLHHRRGLDAEVAQRADHLSARHCGRRQQQSAAGGVRLGENVVAVVEVVELLRQLEGIARQVRGLRRRNRLFDQRGQPRGQQPRLPQAGSLFASRARTGPARRSRPAQSSSVVPALRKMFAARTMAY